MNLAIFLIDIWAVKNGSKYFFWIITVKNDLFSVNTKYFDEK